MKLKEFADQLSYLIASGWVDEVKSDKEIIEKLETLGIHEVFEKAEIVDYALGLDNIHDGEPVSVKGWGGVGFSSAKDFGFVRLMSQLEGATKERTVVKEKLNAIRKWAKKQSLFSIPREELNTILDFKGIDIIRWNLYPEDFPRHPLFPKSEVTET